jgi:hypothetical protein
MACDEFLFRLVAIFAIGFGMAAVLGVADAVIATWSRRLR